ncbi:hypothetical protein H072_6141 [Dactylellina haptotyla CBS 200.50]|uniref:UNC-45/Cro1/She4 central domain-containing protein n=1 Tax=Dactylellina haptotyla (strain CBS 200.50) TaxID=1284197 RepID=S8AAN5_DACHA|nr:hypothetical protein H072_6141 [Dactylellina haptotyla CBS 200.50]
MADSVDKRATILASTALGLFRAGRLEDAARALREAIHIAPENPTVRAAFQHIQETQDAGSQIPDLCRKLLEEGDIVSGEEAVKIIQSGGNLDKDNSNTIVVNITKYDGDKAVRLAAGKVLGALVHYINEAKVGFVGLVASGEAQNQIFERILQLGPEALDSLTSVILDAGNWKGGQQDNILKSCFQYLLDRISDEKEAEIAVRPVSRLLSVEATRLQSLIGKHEFIDFLTLITDGSKEEIRTGALLATAKYLESIESEKSLQLLADFLTTRIQSRDDEDMAFAFNAAAALFPVATSSLANLFHTDGFVQNLVPSLEGHSQAVELAAINLMSAACVDKTCRDAVEKHCEVFLKIVAASKDEGSTAASLALAKLSGDTPAPKPGEKVPEKSPKTDKEIEELASTFKKLLSSNSNDSKQQSVEGLAYTSLTPSVKESLAADSATIKSLLAMLTPTASPSIIFGVLTTVDNLTRYTKPLSEEQRKMAQLKNYANATPQTKDLEIPKLDQDSYVTKRCKLLLDAGVIPAIVRLTKKTSPQATTLISSILLSLSKVTAHRGTMAQQGAVRLLLQIYNALPALQTTKPDSVDSKDEPDTANTTHTVTAHALSRLLISVNPTLVFSSTLPITSAVNPILTLIQSVHNSTAETRDLLPLFEGLLALTNLASTTDFIRDVIVKKEFGMIEELLLYANDMVQRAAVELVCNLMVSPETVSLFVEGPRSGNRLQILLAIAQADDIPSRLAAGGALAMLTEWDAGVKKILEREGGVKRILEMCEDDEDGVVFRGVVVARNLVAIRGKEAVDKLKMEGGADVLKRVLEDVLSQDEKNGEMVSALVEVLKELVK